MTFSQAVPAVSITNRITVAAGAGVFSLLWKQHGAQQGNTRCMFLYMLDSIQIEFAAKMVDNTFMLCWCFGIVFNHKSSASFGPEEALHGLAQPL